MKVRVKFEMEDRKIDEVIAGHDAQSILAEAKDRVARELGWKGMFVKAMTPLQFAQTAARMYNEKHQSSLDIPQTAEEFITFGEHTGNLILIEP